MSKLRVLLGEAAQLVDSHQTSFQGLRSRGLDNRGVPGDIGDRPKWRGHGDTLSRGNVLAWERSPTDNHSLSPAPEPAVHCDVDDGRHRIGQSVDRECRIVGSDRSPAHPKNRHHHILEAAGWEAGEPVDTSADPLKVAGPEVVSQVTAIHTKTIRLHTGEVTELGLSQWVEPIEHQTLWHECHSSYDICAEPQLFLGVDFAREGSACGTVRCPVRGHYRATIGPLSTRKPDVNGWDGLGRVGMTVPRNAW